MDTSHAQRERKDWCDLTSALRRATILLLGFEFDRTFRKTGTFAAAALRRAQRKHYEPGTKTDGERNAVRRLPQDRRPALTATRSAFKHLLTVETGARAKAH